MRHFEQMTHCYKHEITLFTFGRQDADELFTCQPGASGHYGGAIYCATVCPYSYIQAPRRLGRDTAL